MQAPSTMSKLHNPAEAWWTGIAARDHQTATTLLQAENAGGRHQQSVYELFAEMTEKDGHLYAVLQTRLNGLLGLPRRVIAASTTPAAREAASLVEQVLASFPRIDDFLRALLDGIAKGFAVVEIEWTYDASGRLVISDWMAHPQEWFAFSSTGKLLLLSPPFESAGQPTDSPPPITAPGRHANIPRRHLTPPERKFIVLRFGADCRNPWGRGLLWHAYWLYWFKKNCLKFWAIYNEKYGSPTAIATYSPGTPEEEREKLRDILSALQTDTGVVLPESIELRLLETAKGGEGRSYREFLDWCNDEISKIALGATLTSGEGRRSGSLALGSIHELVRQDYIEADARLLEETINGTLVRWLCELNFGASDNAPRLMLETESPEDLNRRIEVDRALLGLGVPLPLGYFHQRYGRPAPTAEEDTLRFDDANFYQYHLQFGVLTINEVRQRLGMEQVPWGDERTAAGGPIPPAASGSPEDNGRQIR